MFNNENKGLEKATFVLKIIALSFAILTFFVMLSVVVTKFVIAMNEKVKLSHTKEARMQSKKSKARKNRIRHILRQRKIAKHENKKAAKEEDDSIGLSDILDPSAESYEDLTDFIDDLDNLLLDEE